MGSRTVSHPKTDAGIPERSGRLIHNEIVEKLSYAERLGTASPSKRLFPVTFIDQWRANLW